MLWDFPASRGNQLALGITGSSLHTKDTSSGLMVAGVYSTWAGFGGEVYWPLNMQISKDNANFIYIKNDYTNLRFYYKVINVKIKENS